MSTCPKHQFTCRNKRCVAYGRICNGNNDCGDFTDEIYPCSGMNKYQFYFLFFRNSIIYYSEFYSINTYFTVPILNFVGLLTCTSWASPSPVHTCSGKENWRELNTSMNITDMEDCINLCKMQNKNGCCSLDNKYGCHWKNNAFADEISNSTAIQCSFNGTNGMFVTVLIFSNF